jgi:Tfp pilus assembly protein PilP
VKESMRFNLDSMYTKVQNLRYDFEAGNLEPVEICGILVDEDNVYDLLDELYDLSMKAQFGKVTGTEYGRIKAISDERQAMRYATCLAAGMSEERAAFAFTD